MRTNRVTRRSLIGMGAVSGMLLLAACGQSGGEGDGDNGGGNEGGGAVTLDVALWGDASRAELYQSAIDLYMEENPNVTLELQFADLDPYLERLTTQAAAGDLPDVLWMRDTHIGRYGEGGSLLDLSPYIGDTIDVSNLGDAAVSTGQVGDGVYALPTHYVGQAIIYNTDLFEENGIDPESIETWDDLAEVAAELADPANGFWGINDPTLGETHRHFEAYIRQAGQEVFTEDGGLGFDAEVAEEWFTYWQELREAGVIPAPDVQLEADSAGWTNNLLVTDSAAMGAHSTNHLSIIQDLTETPYGLSSIPTVENSTDDWWFFPPILISAGASTEHPDEAAKFIDFILNNVDAGLITGINQGAPSSSGVRDALAPTLTEQQTAFLEQISSEQQQPARAFPLRPEGAGQLNTAITRAGQEIAYGNQTVEEAVATLISEAERALPES